MGGQRGDTGAGAILVIGYGNTLRRDDGAGLLAAEAVSAWRLPGVEALAVHQLTPELAESIAAVEVAIFVDARVARESEPVRVEPIRPSAGLGGPSGHVGDPATLLSLASMAYRRHPAAWVVSIPATELGLGEGLSETAALGLAGALVVIDRLIRDRVAPAKAVADRVGGVPCTKSP